MNFNNRRGSKTEVGKKRVGRRRVRGRDITVRVYLEVGVQEGIRGLVDRPQLIEVNFQGVL